MAAPEPIPNTPQALKDKIFSKLAKPSPPNTIPTRTDPNPKLTAWKRYKDDLTACGFIYSNTVALAHGCYVSRMWPGEPLWILVLGPPSSGKTLPLMLAETTVVPETNESNVTLVSSITPAALITGFGGVDYDKSLMANINNHLVIFKDYGTCLSLGYEQTMAVLAILREAFDGQVGKKFAHVDRSYKVHFNVIAAATASADTNAATMQQLGERFIRYRPEAIVVPYPAPPDVSPAAKEITKQFLEKIHIPGEAPTYPGDKLFKAACVAAKLRTHVLRDHRHHEIEEVPGFEAPYRMVHQLEKTYGGVLVVTGDHALAEQMALRLAKDSIPPRRRLLCNILKENPEHNTVEITKAISLGPTVTRNMLEDLFGLGLITRENPGYPKQYKYCLEESLAKEIEETFGTL